MKKIFKALLAVILLVPIYAKALTTYGESVKVTDYLLTTEYEKYNYNKYLRYVNDIPFDYDKGVLRTSPDFRFGGFVSSSEFNLTKKDDATYLYNGLEFWTLTGTGNNKDYINENHVLNKAKSEYSGVKVTEFVKNNVAVKGVGTFTNPYVFVEGFIVNIGSKHPEYGQIEPKDTSQYVAAGDQVKVRYNLTPGYQYKSNNCNVTLTKVLSENAFKISNVRKDISCMLEFEPRTYEITLNNNCGTPTTSKIYVKYKNGIYSNATLTSTISKITNPTKTGYTFTGYTVTENGQTYQIIDATGNIQAITKDIPFANDKITANAICTPNSYTVTLNNQGATTSGTKSVTAIYDSNMPVITTPTKGNYAFKGYYSSTNGAGTKYYNENGSSARLYQTASNMTLYAHWVDAEKPSITLSKNSDTTYRTSQSLQVKLRDTISGLATGASVKYAWSTSKTIEPSSYSSLSFSYTNGTTAEVSATISNSSLTGIYYLWIKPTVKDVYGNVNNSTIVSNAFYFDNTAPTISSYGSLYNRTKPTYTDSGSGVSAIYTCVGYSYNPSKSSSCFKTSAISYYSPDCEETIYLHSYAVDAAGNSSAIINNDSDYGGACPCYDPCDCYGCCSCDCYGSCSYEPDPEPEPEEPYCDDQCRINEISHEINATDDQAEKDRLQEEAQDIRDRNDWELDGDHTVDGSGNCITWADLYC